MPFSISITAAQQETRLAALPDPGQEMTTWLSAMNNAQTAAISDGNNAVFLQDPTPGRTWGSLVAREVANRVYRVWGTQERRCATGSSRPRQLKVSHSLAMCKTLLRLPPQLARTQQQIQRNSLVCANHEQELQNLKCATIAAKYAQ
jgi:hypothetical protein